MGSRLTLEQLENFINPQSVALVGIPANTGPAAHNIMEIMLNSGYKGRTYPVHLQAEEILGYKVYRSVLELPEVVDLAIIPDSHHMDAAIEVIEENAEISSNE